MALAASLLTGSPVPAEATSAPTATCGRVADGIYSAWVHPLVVAEPTRWWVGSISAGGSVQVDVTDCAGGGVKRVTLGGSGVADDHNPPALGYDETQSSILAFYSTHGAEKQVRYRWIDRATLQTSGEHTVPFSSATTYAQLLKIGNGEIMLLARVGRSWSYRISPDWGQSWGDERVLMDAAEVGQSYTIIRPGLGDPSVAALAFYGHPRNSSYTRIVTGTLDLKDRLVRTASGAVIGGLDEPGGPAIRPEELDQTFVPPTGQRARLLDVAIRGNQTAIAYASWRGSGVTTYRVRFWNGKAWISSRWKLDAGLHFGYRAETRYVGGVAFTPGGLVTSRSNRAGTAWYAESWHCAWSTMSCRRTSGKTYRKVVPVRPYVAVTEHGALGVILLLSKYETYTDYDSDLGLFPVSIPSRGMPRYERLN